MERYQRNIAIKELGAEGQKKLLDSKVLICGCGGLGSGVISCLASAGAGHIGLVDNDFVELSNLNRQFIHKTDNIGKLKVLSAQDRIHEINPDVNVKVYPVLLDNENYAEIVKDYDFIIDCFDSYKSKFLLNEIAVKTNMPLIHGGVTEFYGQATVIVPHKTPCLNCLFPEADLDEKIPQGNISPVVNLIASIQAAEALKLILDVGNRLEGQLLTVDALNMNFKRLLITRSTTCSLCA